MADDRDHTPFVAPGKILGVVLRLPRRSDVAVVVDVPPEVPLDRLTRQGGRPADQARERMDAQAGRAERLAIADIVVDNSGPLAELDRRVDGLWEELRRRER